MSVNVLVVDDERCVRELFEYVLTSAGYEVTSVDSISMAEYAISIKEFDAAFIDVVMPDGDGDKFLSTMIQKQPRANNCLVTAHPDRFLELKKSMTGNPMPVPVMLKPMWAEQILEIIGQMVDGNRQVIVQEL